MSTRTPWLPELPRHWSSPALAHVAKLESGADFRAVEAEPGDGAVPVIGSGGPFAHATRALYSGESVLLGRKGTVDKPLYWNGPFWTVDTMFYTVASPRLLPRYLFYVALVVDYSYFSTNTALPSVSGRDLREMRIPLPPLEEQRRIAEFLDRETAQIDELIAKQEQLISTLAERLAAETDALVTSGEDPARDIQLRHAAVVLDCKHITAEFADEGYPVASIGETGGDVVDLQRAKRTTKLFYDSLREGGRAPRPGDLIFTRNATVGNVSRVVEGLEPFALGQDVCLIRTDPGRIMPEFLQAQLQGPGIRAQLDRYMVGSTFKRVNVQQIRGLRIVVPHLAAQQNAVGLIGESRARIGAVISRSHRAVEVLRERRQALISAVATGQIDVGGAS